MFQRWPAVVWCEHVAESEEAIGAVIRGKAFIAECKAGEEKETSATLDRAMRDASPHGHLPRGVVEMNPSGET
jgi:hypothetical protein